MKNPVELVGAQVTCTSFDYQVRISFTGHSPDGRVRIDVELVIETALSVTDAGGSRVVLEPGTGTSLAPLLGLFGRTVTRTGVADCGALRLEFDDGTGLGVAPDRTANRGASPVSGPSPSWWALAGRGRHAGNRGARSVRLRRTPVPDPPGVNGPARRQYVWDQLTPCQLTWRSVWSESFVHQ